MKPAGTGTPPGRLTSAFACAHAIAAGAVPNAPVIVVGQVGAEAHAAACGLTVQARITPPLGQPRLGRPTLARIAGGVDRIICWSDELAPMVVGIGEDVELVSTLPDRCRVSIRRLTKVACYTDHDTAIWTTRGITPHRLDLPACDPQTDGLSRAAARARLGVDDRTLVFAALGDEPARTNARGLTFMLTVLDATRFPVCGIAPQTARNVIAARRHHRATGAPYRLLLTKRTPSDWLAGVDFAILPPRDDSGCDALLQRYAESFGCETVRLSHSGKASMGPSQGTGSEHESLLDRLDQAMVERAENTTASGLAEAPHA